MATVTFTLKNYLTQQSAIDERTGVVRGVPSQAELAEIVGRHEVTFSRIVSNKSDSINLEMLAAIIKELRSRGFDVHFDDLFSYND